MLIADILFPITALGPGNRIGIWTQGCSRYCKGCISPEFQAFDKSKEISIDELFNKISQYPYSGVTISGGEPFAQVDELKLLIEYINNNGCDDILIYTGFRIEELQGLGLQNIDYILSHISVLVDGPFDYTKTDDIPLRGSSNQRVLILNDKYKESYNKFMSEDKKIDTFNFDNFKINVGIPKK